MMNNEIHSLMDQSVVLRTVTGELVPETVLRVDKFDEKLSLLSTILLKSDKSSLLMVEKHPDDYWHRIQSIASTFITSEVSDIDCKVNFYKLLDSYKYLITNLIDWPHRSLQRLWPFFALFHSFPDLSPFCPNITQLQLQYDLAQKNNVNWVSGCDLVAFRNPVVTGFSPTPPLSTMCVPRAAENGYKDSLNSNTEFDNEQSKRSTPLSNAELIEEETDKAIKNSLLSVGGEIPAPFDVKSIVKEIVSNLSVSKSTSSDSNNVANHSSESHSCESLKPVENDTISESLGDESDNIDANVAPNSLENQILIVERVKYHMKHNQVFLNFQKPRFWLKVNEDIIKVNKELNDVERVFKRCIQQYMNILENRERFYCDSTYIEVMWPLFPHIHTIDISHFLPSFAIDDYLRAKEEID